MARSSEEANVFGTEPAHGGPSVDDRAGKYLPLDARIDAGADRYIIRLPVRRENVTVHREAFVAGTATVRRVQVDEVEQVGDTVRAERLRVDVDGDVSVIREGDLARAPEDREQAL